MKNSEISLIILAIIVGILVAEFFIPGADSAETGKEKQPTWYFGEGLKSGDSFEYSICDSLLVIPASPDHCYIITLQVVALLPAQQEDTWVISAHVDHRTRETDFVLLVSNSSFRITTDGASIPYADSLERTLEWIMSFASMHRPQQLVIGKSWGVVASDAPETELNVMQVDSVQMGDEIIPTYRIGYYLARDSFLQIKDDFPIPIKAVIYKPTSVFRDAPIATTFELLNYSRCNDYTGTAKAGSAPFGTCQDLSSRQPPDLRQKTAADHTAHTRPESEASEAKYVKTTELDEVYDSDENGTETFDEANFLDKLRNSTTDQVLREIYGNDYMGIITSFDKFIELLTNATNTILRNQLNASLPPHER